MNPRLLFIACWSGIGSVAVLGICLLAPVRAEDPKPKALPKPDPGKFGFDDAVRKKYPFESLAGRLEYEKKRVHPDKDSLKLSAETKQALDGEELHIQGSYLLNARTRSLLMLHNLEVKDFTGRPGFGYGRMVGPSPRFLELQAVGSIPFAPAPAQEPNVGPEVKLPKGAAKPATADEPSLPSLTRLESFHFGGLTNFVFPSGFGAIKDREHVAGFHAHGFHSLPILQDPPRPPQEKQKERWQVRRLELVSLLKHEKPAVYISESLPRMEELKSAPTRALTAFEQKALKSLRDGDNLALEANVNQIRMVGGVRATRACLKCHDAERGELLGAFTYVLQRDPPVPVKPEK
jgi:hypothetical protein